MKKASIFLSILLSIGICFNLCACDTTVLHDPNEDETQNTQESDTQEESATKESEETNQEDIVKTPVDIETIGGVVIVGKIGFDEKGWHIVPEQPLNITYTYFIDNPSVFPEQTRISMIDPKDDGVEKSVYLGQTVTVHGEFRFVRNDYDVLKTSQFIGISRTNGYSIR